MGTLIDFGYDNPTSAPTSSPAPPLYSETAPYPAAPMAGYGAPMGGVGAPMAGYGAPMGGVGAPMAGYGAPMGGVGAPMDGYGAPMGVVGAPMGGVGAPMGGYGAPMGGDAAPEPAPAYQSPPYSANDSALLTDQLAGLSKYNFSLSLHYNTAPNNYRL